MLFVPADRPERYAKAIASGANAIVVDLEDAVPAANRSSARVAVRSALDAGLSAFVRINAAATLDGQRDLAALARSAPRGIMIAKTASPDHVRLVREAFPDRPLIALIESIAGIQQLGAIATSPGVDALAFGAYDLCAELGARPTPEVLAAWRSQIVFAARAAGRRAIDTPYLDLADIAGMARDARHAVDFGFDGKLAVHPKQVPHILAAFRPTASELARAHSIVEGAAGGGVSVLDGTMVDRPILLAALRVIQRAESEGQVCDPANGPRLGDELAPR
jgi:citrate lyase subunit beta/citryl-CoA lyase